METEKIAEQKILLVKKILALNDVEQIYKIQYFVDEILKYSQDIEEVEDEFDAKKLSFTEWNKQFDDDIDLETFLPEYGMTLKDFRLKIYNSEKQEGLSEEEVLNRVNSWT